MRQKVKKGEPIKKKLSFSIKSYKPNIFLQVYKGVNPYVVSVEIKVAMFLFKKNKKYLLYKNLICK